MSWPDLQHPHTQAASSRDWIQGATTITRNNVLIEQQMGHNPNPLLDVMMVRAHNILRGVFHIPLARQVVLYIASPTLTNSKCFAKCASVAYSSAELWGHPGPPQKHSHTASPKLPDPHTLPLGGSLSVSVPVIISNGNTNNFSCWAKCVPSPAVP